MRELASIQKRNQKLNCMFNLLGFNEGVEYTSDTRATKLTSLCETTYRLARQEAMLTQETGNIKQSEATVWEDGIENLSDRGAVVREEILEAIRECDFLLLNSNLNKHLPFSQT